MSYMSPSLNKDIIINIIQKYPRYKALKEYFYLNLTASNSINYNINSYMINGKYKLLDQACFMACLKLYIINFSYIFIKFI